MNGQFKWTPDCQAAFKALSRLLVSTPILTFPEYTKPFVLNTDASDIDIGAVLSQIREDGKEYVIAYASRVLTKT